MSRRYRIEITAPARRDLGHKLPEKIATAALEFIFGPLAENPYRVGRQLREPLAPLYAARRGEYRVTYSIHDDRVVVEVVSVLHRRDAYRS